MKRKAFFVGIAALLLTSCIDFPVSPTDPLPMPPEIETNKDLSVKPGDSFFDYCNGSWLKAHPLPVSSSIGGLYDGEPVMDQRVDQLKKSVPDIGRFYALMENMHGQPEKSQVYLDALKAQFPKPATREEAFTTMGKMLAYGIEPWSDPLWLQWKDGKLWGLLDPPSGDSAAQKKERNPEEMTTLIATKAEDSAPVLIIRGMGLDPAQFVTMPELAEAWAQFEKLSLDDLCRMISKAWDSYAVFVSREEMERVGKTEAQTRSEARSSLNYTISYHLAKQFLSAAFKQKYLDITREIQASLRRRIQRVDWMSETTRANALEKLDNYSLCVAYPDEWHMDCVSALEDCETLVEAVHRNDRNTYRLIFELMGGKDLFSYIIIQNMQDSNNRLIPADLTLVNAMYAPEYNAVFIYPAMLLPPIMPENVSDACAYAIFSIIGHEFTHGFDTIGSRYDKDGNLRNWWTVADQMAFEDRRENIIECYSHMELDPERAPAAYGDGNRTQTENIADLGGFLTALDAYKARLDKDGYFGKVYDDQLRKFYESYAHLWCVQYNDAKFNILLKSDVHSHARLRVNGVVMNTDQWYGLYDVNRDNYIYLPAERRAYIW